MMIGIEVLICQKETGRCWSEWLETMRKGKMKKQQMNELVNIPQLRYANAGRTHKCHKKNKPPPKPFGLSLNLFINNVYDSINGSSFGGSSL